MTSRWSIIFFIAMVAATLYSSTAQTTTQFAPAPSPSRRTFVRYVVGDTVGWTIPSSLNFYADWASNKTFFVGDSIVFNFATETHNAAAMTSKADFDSCTTTPSTTNSITTALTSPAAFVLNSPGEYFYVCTIPGHCNAGMKLSITTDGFVPPPPSPNSASKFVVASAMPITLLSIAFALFY